MVLKKYKDECDEKQTVNYVVGGTLPTTLATSYNKLTAHFDKITGITSIQAGKNLFLFHLPPQRIAQKQSHQLQIQRKFEVPLSETGHHAFISFVHHDANDVGLFALTREGVYRYWPSILYPHYTVSKIGYQGTYVRMASSLLSPSSVFVSTSDNKIFEIKITKQLVRLVPVNINLLGLHPSNADISSYAKSGSSYFGTSFLNFFGSTATTSSGHPTSRIKSLEVESHSLYVLTEEAILPAHPSTKKAIPAAALIEQELMERTEDQQRQKVWLLDFKPLSSSNFFVLSASAPKKYQMRFDVPLMSFHIWYIKNGQIQNDIMLKWQPDYEQDQESELLNAKLLLTRNTKNGGYELSVIWKNFNLVVTALSNTHQTTATIPGLCSAGLIGECLLLLSNREGILIPEDQVQQLSDMYGEKNYSEESTDSQQEKNKSKRAEDAILTNIPPLSKEIPRYLLKMFKAFVEGRKTPSEQDSSVISDESILEASRIIVDAKPSFAYRWATDDIASLQTDNANASLLILQQLKQKKQRFSQFIQFIRSIPHVLNHKVLELGEKLEIGVNLRSTLKIFPLFQEAVYNVCKMRDFEDDQCTPETFYTNVSSIDQLLGVIYGLLEKSFATSNQSQHYKNLWQVNSVFETFIDSIKSFRKDYESLYDETSKLWTHEGNFMNILKQQIILNKQLLFASVEPIFSIDRYLTTVFPQLHTMIDFYLEITLDLNKSVLIESQNLIGFLMTLNCYDFAITLAEKFKYFPALIEYFVEREQNVKQLREYMSRFRNDKFPEQLFDYFLKTGRIRDLLSPEWSDYWQKELKDFVKKHEKNELEWMHNIQLATICEDSLKNDHLLNAASCIEVDIKYTEVLPAKTRYSIMKLACLAVESSKATQQQEDLQKKLLLHSKSQYTYLTYQDLLQKNFGYLPLDEISPDPMAMIDFCCKLETGGPIGSSIQNEETIYKRLRIAAEIFCEVFREESREKETNGDINGIQFKILLCCWDASHNLKELVKVLDETNYQPTKLLNSEPMDEDEEEEEEDVEKKENHGIADEKYIRNEIEKSIIYKIMILNMVTEMMIGSDELVTGQLRSEIFKRGEGHTSVRVLDTIWELYQEEVEQVMFEK